MDKDLERLLSKVKKIDDCWMYTGAGNIYGVFWFAGANEGAHKVSYMLHKGDIPKGMQVCHTCDNPKCINPDHLFLGSAGINAQDRVRKGRNRKQDGELQERAKLTNEQVRQIRRRYAQGGITQAALRKDYGVSQATMSDIINNRVYREEKING